MSSVTAELNFAAGAQNTIGVAVVKKQASVEGEQYIIFFCNASSRFHRVGLLSLEKKKKGKSNTKASSRQGNVGSQLRARRSRLRRQGELGRFMFKPLHEPLSACPWTGPLTFLCFSDLFVNCGYFCLIGARWCQRISLLWPQQALLISSGGGLFRKDFIYIYLTSIYHVGSECEHTFQRVKYKVITFPLLSLFCWKN